MMTSNLCYAGAETITPGKAWCEMSDAARLTCVNNTMAAYAAFPNTVLVAIEAKQDGQVIIRLLEPVSADKRGTLLLDLEFFLKESIDPGVVVWLEPFGDRNSLRNLRGIEVKS
ncbi:hypothetical protein [Methylomonas rivi]|uniref:Uncharacterized protein n=1 Tax=Methylomonas rivi TaxID=2952226 RepID=A0ABT1U2P5_9GAMM|nr:hypothetical protein [Methylomonas sp. WSC-6]MCQ8127901.1 hypothetical protein [Methylomonas sp. WSC-6]